MGERVRPEMVHLSITLYRKEESFKKRRTKSFATEFLLKLFEKKIFHGNWVLAINKLRQFNFQKHLKRATTKC